MINTGQRQIFQHVDKFGYPVQIWERHIRKSLDKINEYDFSTSGPSLNLIELGAGLSPLKSVVSKDCFHLLVDVDFEKARKIGGNYICADMHRLPIRCNSIDVVVSITSMQYVDRMTVFAECQRVLRTGGIVAIHENGSSNPFILIARLTQRIIGLINRSHSTYRNTIKSYYEPTEVYAGFELIYCASGCLLGPLLFMIQRLKVPIPPKFVELVDRFDDVLISNFPSLKKYCFMNVAHYKKVS